MDLDGGMDPTVDEIASVPPRPEFMEGVNMWIWDAAARVGLPRIAVDGFGARWTEAHAVSVNVALPDGRVFIVRGAGPPHPVADEHGRPRVMGAGPLRFECVEPFRHWRLTFDGLAGATTTVEQIANRGVPRRGAVPEDDGVPLRIEVDTRMSVAPWVNGTYEPDGPFVEGEHRIEQVFTASGVVEIDGVSIPFEGGGSRIHRKGNVTRSDYSDWLGHVWMSTQFPSGRAFGVNNYHPHPDGRVRYHEGWLLDDGEIVPAKFVEAPWKKSWVPSGEDVSFTLRTPRGDVHIDAETFVTIVNAINPVRDRPTFPSTQQGIARYRWNGEEAYGMIERSSKLEPPATAT
jgi:hypothetical protein